MRRIRKVQRNAAEQIQRNFQQIHCLVNSVGIGAKAREGESFQETFERLIKVNLMGMFYSCSAFAEHMMGKAVRLSILPLCQQQLFRQRLVLAEAESMG